MDESQNDCAGQKEAEKKSHTVLLNLHKSLENANLSIMTENSRLPEYGRSWEAGIMNAWRNFGSDGYVLYFKCDDFTGAYMWSNVFIYTLKICTFLYVNYNLIKLFYISNRFSFSNLYAL